MWWPAVVKSNWELLLHFPLRLDYGRSPHAYVNQRLQIQLELLMMSGIPLETCWAFIERWNNKFCYKVASCWLFLLNHTRMHGSMNVKNIKFIHTFFLLHSLSFFLCSFTFHPPDSTSPFLVTLLPILSFILFVLYSSFVCPFYTFSSSLYFFPLRPGPFITSKSSPFHPHFVFSPVC